MTVLCRARSRSVRANRQSSEIVQDMKIILSIVLTPLLFNSWSIAQTADENMEKLKRVNSEVIAKSQIGEYDDALKSAKIALDLSIVIFGPQHVETAVSYA